MNNQKEVVVLQVDIIANNARIIELATDSRKAKEEFALLQKQINAGAADVRLLDAANAKLKTTLAANSQETRVLTNACNAQLAANKAAAISTKDFTGGLASAASQGLKPFQSELDRGSGLLSKFKSGSDLVKQGLKALQPAGEEGAQGFKAVAAGVALTGLGIFLILLQSVISYFTQTNEGSKLLKQGLAALGAVVTTLSNSVFSVGKGLVAAFNDPKRAASEFLDFLKSQVVNRLAAFGVLIDGIRNRDFKKITDSLYQFEFGVTNVSDKVKAYAANIATAAGNAQQLTDKLQVLSKQRKELEVDEIKEKGRVDELLRLSKDRTLSATDRLNKLKEAGQIETKLSADSLDITKQELALLQQRNKEKGLSTTSDEIQEERDKRKEYNQTVAERNSTLAAIKARQSRFVLEERAEQAKAREDAVKERIAATEAQLLTVKQGSAEELELQHQLTLQKAELERAAANKSAADRKLITAQSLAELLKQEEEYQKNREEAAAKQLAREDAGRITAYNAEKKREEDKAKDVQDNYKREQDYLERYLERRRAALDNDLAEGRTQKVAYDKQVELLDSTTYAARIMLAKHFGQDTSKLEADQAKAHGVSVAKLKKTEEEVYASRLQTAESFGQEVGSLFVETLGKTGQSLQEFAGKVLVLILDQLEKAALAAQAEAVIKNAPAGPAGFVLAAVEAAAIQVAFEGAKALITASAAKPFNTGGVVPGDTSRNVDSQLVYATPGEIILSQGVGQKYPELLPVMSHLNSLAGGVNFAPGFVPGRPATTDGGLAARAVGGAPAIDYQQLAAAMGHVQLDVGIRTLGDAVYKANKGRNATTLGGKPTNSIPNNYQ